MSVTALHPLDAARTASRLALTVGVEEEFLLLDPRSWQNAPRAAEARAALPAAMHERSQVEFRRSMMEMVTPVCADLPQLRAALRENRVAAGAAATAAGARLVAVAATPVGEPDLEVVDTPRFHAIARHYGPIAYDPALCGFHVHVGVPDRELAIQVCNWLRPWLPVVQALTANSPFHAGADSGHASWRGIALERWPSLSPSPYLRDWSDYERIVAELVASGVMLDASMVLWWARPSLRYPTVEIRVGDVCPTAAETTVVAGLARALVATAIADIADGAELPRPPEHLLRAAHWNAAHAGVGGTLLDLRSHTARPAWELVADLVDLVEPALDRHGDAAHVVDGLAVLREHGTGADRQRRSGSLPAAMDELAEATVTD
ncbi:glutamate--cysteine ligase [Dactylosporangium vinaceum]|uniref:Putative glutamate--cysteine ligase 2 n=1 Tax=Dactylosporangium vinaceum TaxID=53362 RepID=A0ABV5M6G2_9ACTN|nr:glutamate--cysteine ligase [Dactylosporangium vinaceum]UAC01211.1 glutamate--cysteine ligase [Dactylosporangium vinaceum]